MRLLYANRDAASVIFDDALEQLAARHPARLEVRHHLDADGGFLTADDIAAFARRGRALDADVYICGPGPFMDLVETTLLGLGVEQERIYMERFLVEQQEKDAALTTRAGNVGRRARSNRAPSRTRRSEQRRRRTHRGHRDPRRARAWSSATSPATRSWRRRAAAACAPRSPASRGTAPRAWPS